MYVLQKVKLVSVMEKYGMESSQFGMRKKWKLLLNVQTRSLGVIQHLVVQRRASAAGLVFHWMNILCKRVTCWECDDYIDWRDSTGADCSTYSTCWIGGWEHRESDNPDAYIQFANRDGFSARDACCNCGGGTCTFISKRFSLIEILITILIFPRNSWVFQLCFPLPLNNFKIIT